MPPTANHAPSARQASALDGDTLDLRLRFFILGQGDGQHAVSKAGIHLVFLYFVTKRDAALEAAIDALRELAALVLGLRAFLAPERQHTVVEQDFNILLLKARHFGGHCDILFAVRNFDAGPAAAKSRDAAQGRQAGAEPAESVVEQPVHLSVQRQEGVALAIAKNARSLVGIVPAPRDQITDTHFISPFHPSN